MTDSVASFDLSGRIAVVTGAGSGFGRVIAQELAGRGAHVMCADVNEAWAKETAGLVSAAGGKADAVAADVTSVDSVAALARHVQERGGRVDVLFNNAGIATVPARVHELPVEDWDRLMAINLRGVFLCTRAIIPLMLGRSGSIVNVASIVGMVGYYPGTPSAAANYAASKAGVIGFTRQAAVEYARDGIRINAIAPGWHGGTRLGDARRAVATREVLVDWEQNVVSRTPMGRRGTPDEIRGLALYLASDASRFVTGQVFVQDGGWTAQ